MNERLTFTFVLNLISIYHYYKWSRDNPGIYRAPAAIIGNYSYKVYCLHSIISCCQLLSVPDILFITGLLYVSLSNGISRVHWIRLYVASSTVQGNKILRNYLFTKYPLHFPLSSFSDYQGSPLMNPNN